MLRIHYTNFPAALQGAWENDLPLQQHYFNSLKVSTAGTGGHACLVMQAGNACLRQRAMPWHGMLVAGYSSSSSSSCCSCKLHMSVAWNVMQCAHALELMLAMTAVFAVWL